MERWSEMWGETGIMGQIQRKDLFEAAAEAHRKRDFAKAGSLYSQFVKLNPHVPEAWEKLGVLLAEIGKYEEAENCLRGVLQHLPDWSQRHRLHAHLCWILSVEGRPGAIEEGREAVRLDPQYESGWLNLASALVLAGHYDEAVASYERAQLRSAAGGTMAAFTSPSAALATGTASRSSSASLLILTTSTWSSRLPFWARRALRRPNWRSPSHSQNDIRPVTSISRAFGILWLTGRSGSAI